MNRKKILVFIVILLILISVTIGLNIFKNYDYSDKKLVPKPGSCLILQEKYCKKGVPVSVPWKSDELAVGFNLPKGTTVFSPIDGKIISPMILLDPTSSDNTSTGFTIKNKSEKLTYDHLFLVRLNQDNRFIGERQINQGDVLANITENIDHLNNYNLIYVFSEYDETNKQIISTKEKIKSIFSLKN